MERRRTPRRERLRLTTADQSIAEKLAMGLLDAVVMPLWSFGRDRLVSVLERRHGIHTAGIIPAEELGIADAEQHGYSPAPWSVLRRAIPPEWVRTDDVFIDFGSGMGRIVFQAAAHYPFRRVIGVELSRDLHQIAQANVERNRPRFLCQNVELVNGNVLDYDIPDDVTMAFFFNPFTGQTFDTVIDRLLASVDTNPRWLRIVYLCPVEHERLLATGRVRLVHRVRRPRPGREWSRRASIHLYDVLPARTGETARVDALSSRGH
ncbi:class I SAM-dependent methyltransferase [Nonomuraea sp. NBC_00507]|uniref:class I SAM-dependent methyltransferase n=1 Tax=Nonomuraea sp. NBC_00507 TaxID=2976002 RepID=UPI002E18F916